MPAPGLKEIASVEPATPQHKFAVIGLILAVVGLVVPLISLGAIGWSIVTFRSIPASNAPVRRPAILSLVLGGIGLLTSSLLLVGLLVYSAFYGRGAQQLACATQMRKISQALMLYAHEDRRLALPPDLATLARVRNLPPAEFIDPADSQKQPAGGSTSSSYRYPWRPGWNATIAPTVVLLYEPLAHHGGKGANFMFGDTSIKWFDATTAQEMIKQIEAGTNPPQN